MAINPGSDLLSDALLAAEPRLAKAATERLGSLAASDGAGAPAFEQALDAEAAATPRTGVSKSPLTVTIGSQETVVRNPPAHTSSSRPRC